MTTRDRLHGEARARVHARVGEIIGAAPTPRLDEALTHRSFANEERCADNQRLEFLGDAVLDLCVSEMLVREHAGADEGALSRMHDTLVNTEALARWARTESLGDAIAFGKGARAERERTNVLADAVEAIIAAVFDAHGLDAARKLVAAVIAPSVAELETRDPKSLLQERVQARGGKAPTYRLKATHGAAQSTLTFEMEVVVDGEVAGVGQGKSKRVAERNAAADALVREESLSRRLEAAAGAAPTAAASETPTTDPSAEDRSPHRTEETR